MASWQFTPYAIIYISAACISFVVAALAWRMRPVRTTGIFSILALTTGIWVLGYLLGFFNTDISHKLVMLRFEYFGILSSGYLWLIFIAKYTHQDKWLKKWVYWILAIIPVFSFFQILFVENHSFFYRVYEFSHFNDLIITKKVYGPGFYISAVYNYSLIIIGTLFLIRRISHMPEQFWKQNIPLALVLVFVLIPNFLYISGNNPIPPYDPTPLSFVVIGVLFIFAIYVHRFLDVVPVAYNLIFKDMKNGVIIIDKRGHILDMNKSAGDIFDYDVSKAIGKNISNLFSDQWNDIKDFFNTLGSKTETKLGAENRYYDMQISAMEDYHKNLIGRIILLYDINDQKKAIEELDAFARTVAHDLKNPLGNIIGFTQLIEDRVELTDDQIDYVQNIGKSAGKMNKIIEGLLMLAKVRNQEKIETVSLNMAEIVETAVSRLSSSIEQSKAKIFKPDGWPKVLGDPLWIEVVWVNYLSNAIKYGGKPPIIDLSSEPSGDYTQFRIKDNGNGLNKEEQESLFIEFSRLPKHKHEITGHGLGLSIVQRIIERLGGDVGIESDPGKGSTFYFTLPNAIQ